MKKILLPAFITAFIVCFSNFLSAQPWLQKNMVSQEFNEENLSPQNFYDIKKKFEDHWKGKTPNQKEEGENRKEGGYQQFRRWQAFIEPRVFPTGNFSDPEILVKEYRNHKAVQRQLSVHPAVTAANWTVIGPEVLPTGGGGAGRINCIRFDPTNTNTIYIGTANGGVWKTTTGGTAWSSNSDFLDAIGIADIAINPRYPDSVFIATGDGYGYEVGGDFWGGTYSAGVMVSPDGGQTWNTTGLSYVQTNSNIIQRILISPTDPDILLAATRTGIYRTIDAGANWTLVQSGHYYDMEFKPGSPNTVYASKSSGLSISTNLGVSWSTGASASASGRLSIAVTESNPAVVYALGENGNFYKSTNSGQSLNSMASPDGIANLWGYYDAVLAVSPVDENKIFVGGLAIARSTNGGTSWSAVSTSIHVDNHALEFLPGNNNVIWCGNDGGIYSSTSSGSSWVNHSSGLGIKQYYRIGCSTLSPYTILAGAQDNGTDRLRSGTWAKIGGGDGMDCMVDRTNDQVMYISSQNGNFDRSINGGTSWVSINPSGGAWTTPIIQDPIVANTIIGGWDNIYRSTNRGTSWTQISNGQIGGEGIALAMSAADNNVIYAASLGRICRTDNLGGTWVNITSGIPVANAAITWIAVANTDPMKVWVTLSGYSGGNKVFASANGGANWTNYSGTLPNVPTNCIVYQDFSQDALYIGTDFGVYYRDANMADWIAYDTNLPRVIVDDLEINYDILKLRAGTFGRGIWESDLNTSSSFAIDAGVFNILTPGPTTLCSNSFEPVVRIRNYGQTTLTSVTINYQIDGGTVQPFSWTGSIATGGTSDVTLPLVTSTTGPHSFTCFTSDPNGTTDQNTFNDTRTVNFTINSAISTVPVTEGFDAPGFPPVNWVLNDPAGMCVKFQVGGFGNSDSSFKARGISFASTYGSLVSSPVDLTSALAPASLTFSVAYRMRSATNNDSLKVYVSADCGTTWNLAYAKTNTNLATAATGGGNFTPTPAQWRTDTVSLTSYIGQPGVLVQFEFFGNNGNNIYVDDINIIDGTIGIEQNHSASLVSVFPNPTSGYLHFNLPGSDQEGTINFYSALGKEVRTFEVNSSSVELDISGFSQGIYFYEVVLGGRKIAVGRVGKE